MSLILSCLCYWVEDHRLVAFLVLLMRNSKRVVATFYLLTIAFFWIGFRVVGGLLSSYDLSGDKIFLDKAKDIADRLLPAWDTPSGIPYNFINLVDGRPHNPSWTGVSS